MQDDALLLGSLPDQFSIPTMLKAHASDEGGERIIYIEASREDKDQQGEIVLAKALKASADHFVRFGCLDLEHRSIPSVAQRQGLACPEEWIIGVPLEVKFDGNTTFVKARLHSGDTPLAEKANMVWDGLTKLNPPRRYYASVAGAVMGREVRTDPKTGERTPVITATRWNSLALTVEPVNQHLVQPTSTTPIGVFSKSLGGWVVNKSLTAGYATDSATLTGGSALRGANGPANYFEWRDSVSARIRDGKIKAPNAEGLIDFSARNFGMQLSDAAEYVERFLRDLKTGLTKRRTP